MKSLLGALIFALTLLNCSFLLSEDNTWIEVRSPHFLLMTNAGERDGRHMLRQFELIRAVFDSQFPGFKLETPSPSLIIAAKDEYTAKQLVPQRLGASGAANCRAPGGSFGHD